MKWLILVIFCVQLKASDIEELFHGNKRFLQNQPVQNERRQWLTQQEPFFCILSCADSRVPPEIIFSQSLGSIFVVRNAGNVVDEVALASIEFAIENLKVSTLIVLGHQNCGAVRGALELTLQNAEVTPESLHAIFKKIQPGLSNVVDTLKTDQKVLDQASQDNAIYQLKVLLKKSKIIREAYRENKLFLFSLYYEMDTGKVYKLDGV